MDDFTASVHSDGEASRNAKSLSFLFPTMSCARLRIKGCCCCSVCFGRGGSQSSHSRRVLNFAFGSFLVKMADL